MKLRTINQLLAGIAVLAGLYIALAPVLPQLSWWLKHDSFLANRDAQDQPGVLAAVEPSRSGNWLVIPRLALDTMISEDVPGALSKGVVRRAGTSTPEQGSNTVLAGHRFTYGGSGIFYHLDKIQQGDLIGVFWNGVQYTYRVSATAVVSPDAVGIEAPTASEQITIYTCTPLWSAKDRLVVTAVRSGQ